MNAGLLPSPSPLREHLAPGLWALRGEQITLRDKGLWILFALVLALELWVWNASEGYPIADAVEFMERARTLVRGEQMIDTGAIRPFGFSVALMPIFLVGDWLGLPDPRALLWCACALQMVVGLLLVWGCVRIGARLGGRRVGLAAGFLAGTNPVFLEYAAQPISGVAAAACVAFGIQALLERPDRRAQWIGAIWLSVAVTMIYQCLVILGAVAVFSVLRERRAALPFLRRALMTLTACILVQALLDLAVYGVFGRTLWIYLVQNVSGQLASICVRLRDLTHLQWFWRRAHDLYAVIESSEGKPYTLPTDQTVRSKSPMLWYFAHMPSFLVWPVLALVAIALARWLVRREFRGRLLMLWFVLAINVAAVVVKPLKDFRLWLPLLPLLAPLCAWAGSFGWSALGSRASGELVFWRRTFTASFAAATVLLSLAALNKLETRSFGGYWQAMEFVNQLVREAEPSRRAHALSSVGGGPAPRVRVGSAYNWAVFLREAPRVELVKLPWQLNLWNQYDTKPERKLADFEALAELDLFVTHLPILSEHLDLLDWVNQHFQVCGAVYDQLLYEPGLGPLLVLSRRHGAGRESTFYDLRSGEDPEEFCRRRGLEQRRDFASEDGSEKLSLLGFEYVTLPPEGLGWITYHWYSPTGLRHPYTFVDRISALDETNVWQNNHSPAWRALPSEKWQPGTFLSEGCLVVPCDSPYQPPNSEPRPIGGGYRRGDLIPVRLWYALLWYGEKVNPEDPPLINGRLDPVVRGSSTPTRPMGDGTYETPDGTRISDTGFVHVGTFFLPVMPPFRVRDDGRPIPPGGSPTE